MTASDATTRPHARSRIFSRVAALATGLIGIAGLTGCQPGDYRATFSQSAASNAVEIQGPSLAEADSVAIDITNEAGTVVVTAEEWRTEPEVTARVRWARGKHGFGDDNLPGTATATSEITDGRGVLRVDADLADGAPDDARIDVVVRLPACDGIWVRNAGGTVILKGIGGAMTVENGLNGRGGGRIEIRTNRPVIDPVALLTTDGRITMVITPESRAQLDLASETEPALFSTAYGSTADVRTSHRTWQGIYNGGDNLLRMRSGDGEVRVIVHEDPEMFSVADGFASLFD